MSDFKISKRSIHSDNRSTIMEKHESKMKEFEKNNKTRETLIKKIDKCKDDVEKQKLEEQLNSLKTDDMNEYLFNLVDFLREEESREEIATVSKTSGINKFVSLEHETFKGNVYDNYMAKCHGKNKIKKIDSIYLCDVCKSDMIHSQREALLICYECGNTTSICCPLANPEWNSYENHDFTKPFSYKRSNHFKEWINQIQGREGTNIPSNIIELLVNEIKKERITDKKLVSYDKIKEYLKKLKLNKYYEHIPNIIHSITGNRQLIISQDLEEKLVKMFDDVQEPFAKHCPSNRKNFLSYSYTLYKFFQLLDLNEYLVYFPLLKSREKLFEQELIWKNICSELNWTFIRCI